jgi:hypothetical protein
VAVMFHVQLGRFGRMMGRMMRVPLSSMRMMSCGLVPSSASTTAAVRHSAMPWQRIFGHPS